MSSEGESIKPNTDNSKDFEVVITLDEIIIKVFGYSIDKEILIDKNFDSVPPSGFFESIICE